MDVNKVVADVIVGVIGLAMTVALAAAKGWLDKHASAKQLALMQEVVAAAVQATEQIAGVAQMPAEAKMAAAVARAKDLGAKVGVDFSDEQLRTLIEQAVHDLGQFQSGVISIPPPTDSTGRPLSPATT